MSALEPQTIFDFEGEAPQDIELAAGTTLDYFMIFGLQPERRSTIKFILQDNSNLNFKAIVLGGQSDQFELDLHMIHRGSSAISNADIRAVMSGSSKARLTGLIKIEETGHKTQAFLEERALLLSDNARVQTIPQLEIETDDVQATHAAAVAKLSEEQLFYLQARGLPLDTARELIISSFLFGNFEENTTIQKKLTDKLGQILINAEY